MPASLSPTQLMPQTLVGFQQHKGNGMPIARESKEDAVVRLRDEPKCLREMQGWHGVAGNANCSLQYTLVGSQHCQLLLVPSTASGGRPHGRRRRPSLKGLWKATIQVVMPVSPLQHCAAVCQVIGCWKVCFSLSGAGALCRATTTCFVRFFGNQGYGRSMIPSIHPWWFGRIG